MKTHIDWVTFRCKTNPYAILERIQKSFGECGELVALSPCAKGRDGWEFGQDIVLAGDITLGHIDYGGNSQRDWVRCVLTGTGCDWVLDWSAFTEGLILLQGELRRVDIALTTYDGSVTDAMVAKAKADGRFTTSGRAPVMRTIVSDNPLAGVTRYIGSREKSDKMLRCYEKGKEMLKHLPENERILRTHIGDDKVENIYRVELELKAVTKEISLNVFLQRDHVFANAYPFCADLLPAQPEYVRKALPSFKPEASLEGVLAHCKNAYGGAIFTAIHLYGREKVLDMICGVEHSRKLVDSGVLTL